MKHLCYGHILVLLDLCAKLGKISAALPYLVCFVFPVIKPHVDTLPIFDHMKVIFGCGLFFSSVFSRVALDRAAVLLTMKREMVRLDNVWGVGGGLRPVKHLVKEVTSG